MFIDEAVIEVRAGKGGDGLASFRREKFIPKGGPDGGDGGDGGDVYLIVKEDIHGLAKVAAQRKFIASNGQSGRTKKQHGADGKDMMITVPPGTIVWSQNHQEVLVIDTGQLGQKEFLLARGGKGGLGNVHFAFSTNRAPRQFTVGKLGQQFKLRLEVQHIADVGLVGLPNAGKSTLISVISAARPKIANYPFTTLEPNLGTVTHKNERFIIADIPGLIEGASRGKGLGDKFLRHLNRTSILIYLIDASDDPKKTYRVLRQELKAFDPAFLDRPEIIVFSKIDLIDQEQLDQLKKALKLKQPLFISAITHKGLEKLLDKIIAHIAK